MRIAGFCKIAEELTHDLRGMRFMHDRMVKDCIVLAKKKGLRLIRKRIKFFEQDADNFIYNRVTVVTEYDGFRAPRIVLNIVYGRKINNKVRR